MEHMDSGSAERAKPGRTSQEKIRLSNSALRAEITFPELVGHIAKLTPSGCQVKVVSFVNLERHSKLRFSFVFFIVVCLTINISLTVNTFGHHNSRFKKMIINFSFICELI